MFDSYEAIIALNAKRIPTPKIDLIEEVLRKDTISGEMLRLLKEKSEYEGIPFDYHEGKGGFRWFKMGDETVHSGVHMAPDGGGGIVISTTELRKYPWWKDIVYTVLEPGIIILNDDWLPIDDPL